MRFSLRQWIVIEILLLGNALLVVMLAVFFFGNGLANAQFGEGPATQVILIPSLATDVPPTATLAPATFVTATEPLVLTTTADSFQQLSLAPSFTPTSVAPGLSATPFTVAATATGGPVTKVLLDVNGQPQALPLSCESRSAADWAAYFGTAIDELEFFSRLPQSDNPDKGFVGDVRGQWGGVPPNAYGVHAEPVAAVLRDYGLSAQAVRGMTWDDIKAELNAGRPVITWVVGHIWANGKPMEYIPLDGTTVIVAPYEHTVMVVGYDPVNAIIRDGAKLYARPVESFMLSWAPLGNMAVVWR
jgi:uncharacterized protein YvpB